jgi:arylsulfatase A-like enzyme
VTEQDMPTLSALAKQGTFFANHHPVFVTTTEVNGTALSTGMTPASSGVMANREYRPDVDLLRPVDTQGQWASWKGDRLSDDAWIRTPTLPELVRAAGMRTAVAGSKGVAIIWDRGIKNRRADGATLFEGKSIPSAVLDGIMPDLGPFPPGVDNKHFVNYAQDQWTTRVLTEKQWAPGVPPLSVLWLSEPDYSQHGTGPGSEQGKAALRSSDDRLSTALAELERKGVRDQTDVIVVSDHGFSTSYRKVDVGDQLRRNKFKAEGSFHKTPEKGSVMVVGLGGSVAFYVIGRDAAVREQLVTFLQKSDWAGVIFTKDGAEGTFRMADVGIETPNGPDVVVSFKWKDETMKGHAPGLVVTDGADAGQGAHGSLSKYDLRNTLIAAGPDFKRGLVNLLPSGNSDVSPTVAALLGITPPRPMDGRVLTEALADGVTTRPSAPPDADGAKDRTETLRAQRKVGEAKTRKQYLEVTTYQGRRYYNEGNVVTDPPATAATAPTTAPATAPATRPAGPGQGK